MCIANNLVCVLYKSKSLPQEQSPRWAAKPSSPLVRPARVNPVTFSPMCNISPIKSQESHWTVSLQTGPKPSGVSAAGVQLYTSLFFLCPKLFFSQILVSVLCIVFGQGGETWGAATHSIVYICMWLYWWMGVCVQLLVVSAGTAVWQLKCWSVQHNHTHCLWAGGVCPSRCLAAWKEAAESHQPHVHMQLSEDKQLHVLTVKGYVSETGRLLQVETVLYVSLWRWFSKHRVRPAFI